MSEPRVLWVDDEETGRTFLIRFFDEDYEVTNHPFRY